MTPYTFDTLSASKRLREAGMAEGVAEAVVAVFQHAASSTDFSHLATRDDLAAMRGEMATKVDIAAVRSEIATRADIADMAKKADLLAMEVRVGEQLRTQMFQMAGIMTALLGLFTAVIKLFP